jgi:hypothetical protein
MGRSQKLKLRTALFPGLGATPGLLLAVDALRCTPPPASLLAVVITDADGLPTIGVGLLLATDALRCTPGALLLAAVVDAAGLPTLGVSLLLVVEAEDADLLADTGGDVALMPALLATEEDPTGGDVALCPILLAAVDVAGGDVALCPILLAAVDVAGGDVALMPALLAAVDAGGGDMALCPALLAGVDTEVFEEVRLLADPLLARLPIAPLLGPALLDTAALLAELSLNPSSGLLLSPEGAASEPLPAGAPAASPAAVTLSPVVLPVWPALGALTLMAPALTLSLLSFPTDEGVLPMEEPNGPLTATPVKGLSTGLKELAGGGAGDGVDVLLELLAKPPGPDAVAPGLGPTEFVLVSPAELTAGLPDRPADSEGFTDGAAPEPSCRKELPSTRSKADVLLATLLLEFVTLLGFVTLLELALPFTVGLDAGSDGLEAKRLDF